jgi:phosphoribosyl 1,2-cyclic phosphate phosphodiesterase
MKVTILGCGGSGGVPLAAREPGGFWGACDPANPKNRRRRVSILVEEGATALLVDTSPDLRLQILDHAITRLDAVLFTHAHGDHCHGIDDLRALSYSQGGPIDAFMDATTRDRLTRRFGYIFASARNPDSLYPPLLTDRTVDVSEGPFRVGVIDVVPFVQGHGPGETTLGYRFGPAAYSTDLVSLDEAAFAALAGVKLWVVDCLRFRPHPTHTHFDQTMEWIARVKPARAILTHMNHEVDYAELAARCPPGVEPGYDGLVVEV